MRAEPESPSKETDSLASTALAEQNPQDQVYWFRHSAPYIHAYRGRTVVILLPGEVLQSRQHCKTIIQDLALLNSLGLKLVIALGARPQIEMRLSEANVPARTHHDLRITDEDTLRCVSQAVGQILVETEALLSMGLANSPMHGAALRVSSGNYVVARPVGVVDGVDLCNTGYVRKVHADAIHSQLNQGHIVLMTNLGYSPTGEIFNLACEDVASSAAIALQADKMIVFGPEAGMLQANGRLLREITLQQAMQQVAETPKNSDQRRRILAICRALNEGVGRAHLISYQHDGALLQELFTRDGVGTLVTDQGYDQVREASIDDVGGILVLIQPLEQQGILVRRSRELLEQEIHNFIVDERDGSIVACAALYPFPEEGVAELACVAVKAKYLRQGRGDRMLAYAEKRALEIGLGSLFVLTTHTAHWFIERGFQEAELAQLPVARQRMYNIQRNSKVFIKRLHK